MLSSAFALSQLVFVVHLAVAPELSTEVQSQPGCHRDLHILALKMQLIRCQIYIQATDLEFFKGIDAGH